MSIGREQILDEIRREDPTQPRIGGIAGELGSGRTWLLEQLKSGADPGRRAVVVPLEDFDPGHPGQIGPAASVGAVQANFNAFTRLLEYLIAEVCPPEKKGEVARAIQTARNDKVLAGRVISLDSSLQEIERPFVPQDFAQAWRDAAEHLIEGFAEMWDPPADGCVLMLDDADRLADQEIGVWLRRLLSPHATADTGGKSLVRTLVVMTRSPGSDGDGLPQADVTWTLGNFSRDEVGEYLRNARKGAGFEREVVDKVYDITDGHPATLRLVHDLIWGPSLGLQEPLLVLRKLTREADERAAALVERLVTLRDEPGLMAAIQVAAVPRRFDFKLFEALLDPDQMANGSVLFNWLRELPFTEHIAAPEEGTVLRIHEYVRKSIIARMRASDTNRLERLHERAADFYERMLEQDLQDSEGRTYQYGTWYFLEQKKWQERKREWLYHTAQLSAPQQQRTTLLELARLFLDGFWWWGNYVHFDFCDQLLADVAHLSEASPDDDNLVNPQATRITSRSWPKLRFLHGALSDMLANYPIRSAKWSAPDWDKVRLALLEVEEACGLARMPARPSARQRHISGLLHIFLAHTWRYQAPSSSDPEDAYQRADAMYIAADRLFEGDQRHEEDSWSRAWIAFERADMCLTRAIQPFAASNAGAADPAIQTYVNASDVLWSRARDVAQTQDDGTSIGEESTATDEDEEGEADAEEPDHELMSNLHRLRGDKLALLGDSLPAARSYGRAVLHAYLFHTVGGLPPDEYTLQFYVDIRARAVNYLKSLMNRGELELASACTTEMWKAVRRTDSSAGAPSGERLGQLLSDARQGTAVPLAHALFPRGPWFEELGLMGTEFTDALLPFSKGLADGVLLDLHERA